MADEDYPHQGSLFFVTPCVEVAKPINTISERLSKEEGVIYGVSRVLDHAYVLRILGLQGA